MKQTNKQTNTHTYLLNGTAFLKAFSTSATVALASSATVQRPCAYSVLARVAFRRETLTRSTSSLWTPKLSLVWYWDNSSSMLCQPRRLQNTVTIPEARRKECFLTAAQLNVWSFYKYVYILTTRHLIFTHWIRLCSHKPSYSSLKQEARTL